MIENNDKGVNKSVINWYPGHMAKTKKQIIEDLKLIDVVVEILDARIPIASQNPDIKEIIKNKKKLVVLNKSDLSSEKENQKWISYLESQGSPAILVDSVSGKGIPETIKKIKEIYPKEKYQEKGRIGKAIRVMIVGIPNVGKSSFINRIAKRSTAQVGNRPGVTKQKQWIKVENEIELLDTPGVLWPKLEKQAIALNLAFTGTIKEEIINTTDIGYELTKKILKEEKEKLLERYSITQEQCDLIFKNEELEENEKIVEVMKLIGKKRGAIIAGGEVNLERVASIVLEDFRSGKIGRITLEKV